MKVKKIFADSLEQLERFYELRKKEGRNVVWSIGEGLTAYSVSVVEESVGGVDELALYHTGEWNEILEFASTHCNPGYDTMFGIGCTDEQLANATVEYIHSLGEKYKYEDVRL